MVNTIPDSNREYNIFTKNNSEGLSCLPTRLLALTMSLRRRMSDQQTTLPLCYVVTLPVLNNGYYLFHFVCGLYRRISVEERLRNHRCHAFEDSIRFHFQNPNSKASGWEQVQTNTYKPFCPSQYPRQGKPFPKT
jgi:hypothetical protein